MEEKIARRLIRDDQNVSRETMEKLAHYAVLLEKWNPKINLVAKASLEHKWERHFLDSYQIWKLAPENTNIWCDLGSGAGFPGLVVAVLASEVSSQTKFHLVESDARKSAFLRSTARELGVQVEVHTQRIEKLDSIKSEIVSARALAPLPLLLEYTKPNLAENGVCLFLKGKSYQTEIEDARKSWHFDVTAHQSLSQAESAVLEISGISPNVSK